MCKKGDREINEIMGVVNMVLYYAFSGSFELRPRLRGVL